MRYQIQKIGDQLRADTIIAISIEIWENVTPVAAEILNHLRKEALRLKYSLLKDENYCNAVAYLNIK